MILDETTFQKAVYSQDGAYIIETHKFRNLTVERKIQTPGWHLPLVEALMDPDDPLSDQLAELGVEIEVSSCGTVTMQPGPCCSFIAFGADTTRGGVAHAYSLPFDPSQADPVKGAA